jgi:hypothetical protein
VIQILSDAAPAQSHSEQFVVVNFDFGRHSFTPERILSFLNRHVERAPSTGMIPGGKPPVLYLLCSRAWTSGGGLNNLRPIATRHLDYYPSLT